MCVTALKLVAAMKANEVTLLPDLYESFQSDVATRAASFPSLMPIGDVPGPRWLASQLSWYFGEMLIVECKHKRFGSLLYHVNCDLLNAVSLALGRSRLHNKAVYRESVATQPSKASHWDQQIACVADYLNNRVHQQANTFLANFYDTPEKYATFSVEWFYEAIDPKLLTFILHLTQSVRCRRLQQPLLSNECQSEVKRIRQAYLLGAILFCTNSQCSMPFHTLLTEAILCHGGSQELVRILNRVGAVASLDTN